MKKALFISHIPVYPITGGDQIRISQQLEALLDQYRVDLVYITHHPVEPDAMRRHQPRLNGERAFYVPLWRRYAQASLTLANRLPLVANHYYHRPLQRHIDQVGGEYNLIFCGGVATARYLLGHPEWRKYLDMTDSFAMNIANDATLAHGLKRLLLSINSKRMARYELRCSDTFDRVAYISEVDRGYLPHKPGKTCIVGNSVDLPRHPAANAADSRTILFVGRMDYAPNIAAVVNFAHNILPIITRDIPDARFVIAGAAPTPEVLALDNSHVEVTGFVESLDPYFDQAAIVVAPMLSGSGIQNKILQALARGCCVVTTPIGAEGLDTSAGAFEVGVDNDAIATLCVSLLRDRSQRAAIGDRARAYISSTFSPEAIASQFRAFIQR